MAGSLEQEKWHGSVLRGNVHFVVYGTGRNCSCTWTSQWSDGLLTKGPELSGGCPRAEQSGQPCIVAPWVPVRVFSLISGTGTPRGATYCREALARTGRMSSAAAATACGARYADASLAPHRTGRSAVLRASPRQSSQYGQCSSGQSRETTICTSGISARSARLSKRPRHRPGELNAAGGRRPRRRRPMIIRPASHRRAPSRRVGPLGGVPGLEDMTRRSIRSATNKGSSGCSSPRSSSWVGHSGSGEITHQRPSHRYMSWGARVLVRIVAAWTGLPGR